MIVIAKAAKDLVPFIGAVQVLTKPLQGAFQKQFDNFQELKIRVQRRLKDSSDGYTDFVSHFVQHSSRSHLSEQEIISHASLMVAAGTETVAALLSAVVYFLCSDARVREIAVTEIRNNFSTNDDICFTRMHTLEYLSAVLDETLRIFPPVPEGLSRLTPKEGATVCGYYVPGNVSSSSSDLS